MAKCFCSQQEMMAGELRRSCFLWNRDEDVQFYRELIPLKNLEKDPNKKQYVTVSVRSSVCNLEKVVLLSFQSGYIYIQTDKPIYTPGSTVLYRIFTTTLNLKPVSKPVIIEFLTPDNVVVKKDLVQQVKNGIVSLSFKLPDPISLGLWTISAKFEDTSVQSYTTQFEVKEYVLPSYELQITTWQNFFFINDEELWVNLKAHYLYGKPVNGKAFVLFGVKRDNERKGLPDTLRREQISDGEGSAVLRRKDLLKYFQKEEDMLEWRIYVFVTVIDDLGSEMVESVLDDIPIVTSPYKILLTKTPTYFKPGMPFDLMVLVTNPDGSPAIRVPVVAEPGSVKGRTLEDGTVGLTLTTRSDISHMNITVSTTDETLHDNRQASASMVASAYRPIGGNYLHLSVASEELKPGDSAVIKFIVQSDEINKLNYMIINKGRIIKVGTQERRRGQTVVTMLLPITEEFIPSFRILAYYTVTTGAGREIVADSIRIDVEDVCMGTLVVTGEKDKDNAIQQPGASMKLKLQADHMAAVGLVAVDKGVYTVNNKLKISQKKIWDLVEKYDIGCTQGSGADTPGVFHDAGLALATSSNMTTPQRAEPLCQPKLKRRRRSSALLFQERDEKASQYTGLEKECCQDGMLDSPMGHSCERRTRHIIDGPKCIDAFLDCCKHITKQKELRRTDDGYECGDEDIVYSDVDNADRTSRTYFPESWLWKVDIMTENPNPEGISTKSLLLFLPDSRTTWEVLAVGLSESKGICVSEPYNIRVMRDFFIDLKLPYSVVRHEQVEIRAILYNYGGNPLKVRVEWSYNEELCSLSTAKKNYRQIVVIQPSSSRAVPFIIVPLSLGEHYIEVKVADVFISDGVRKKLKVVPEGAHLTQILKSVVLEPEGKGGVQEELISAVDPNNIVPKTDVITIVTVQGSPISEMVEKSIQGGNLSHLTNTPYGCGEQNMMRMTAPLIATRYLDLSNQWERVGVQRREEAIQYIKDGVIQQLTFAKPDASYGAWIHRPSSTWLTAYVVKVFSLASTLIHVDKDVICNSVKWLLSNKQNPDGKFREDAPVYNQEMVGGITRGATELDSSLTAFVLIALLTSEQTCAGQVSSLPGSIEEATQYITNHYETLKKPYSIAITSYALAKAGKLKDIKKLMAASTDNVHWDEPGSRFLSLEATSYALLTLLKMKEFEKAAPLVKWITEQRYYGDIWGSTQSAIMQFEALAQYQRDVLSFKDLDLVLTYKLPGRSQTTSYQINLQTALLARSDQSLEVDNFTVSAKGKGQGTLTVLSAYYVPKTAEEKKCNNFDLSVTIKEEYYAMRSEDAKLTVSMTICTRFLKDYDSTMSILEVSMMTGFVPDINDLNKLKKPVDRSISSFEINKGAYDKSTLILYIDRISHKEENCVKFNLHQHFNVGLIQPGSVTVYHYYSPENCCTKFYHMEEGSKHLGKICQGEVCRCAEANCCMQQQLEEVDALVRLTKACEAGVDYVYKTTLTAIEKGDNYDTTYVMTIKTVIKEGTDVVVVNEKRNFISHAKCSKALNLEIGRDYLIWGTITDLWNTGSGFAYMITRDTWIEMWPNDRECQDAAYEEVCEEFAQFADELEFRGSPLLVKLLHYHNCDAILCAAYTKLDMNANGQTNTFSQTFQKS
ncbi:LOW QUALITY PROTEIN: complement C3-like [Dendropsophus ebraccatus]|uniref:LOW QUALITY PROTEIN: complement C3-like n=1 Tax=Dendropsophus ebraccatus TaxID=150705 RepID=UPI0038310E90